MLWQQEKKQSRSEEINEIITAVPSWILRSGITIILMVLLVILILSSLINYPDIVKTSLRVNASNAPKALLSHQQGRIVGLLVDDGVKVDSLQPLAYLEATGNHQQVLSLLKELEELSKNLNSSVNIRNGMLQKFGNLGDLQANYQNFYQSFIKYINTEDGGFYGVEKAYLKKDIVELEKLGSQIKRQEALQLREYQNAEKDYEAYKSLKEKKVISDNEFRQQENKFISSKFPLEQTSASAINNHASILAKEKELNTLENTVKEERLRFAQSLHTMLSQTKDWLMKYVVISPVSGKLSYAGILEENQNVNSGQELFFVVPENSRFYGQIQIPQYNMGKVAVGQKTLVKLHSFPYEQFGVIRGELSFVSSVAYRDSVFIGKVVWDLKNQKDFKQPVKLKSGMMADAEIITKESSLLQRLFNELNKMLDSR